MTSCERYSTKTFFIRISVLNISQELLLSWLSVFTKDASKRLFSANHGHDKSHVVHTKLFRALHRSWSMNGKIRTYVKEARRWQFVNHWRSEASLWRLCVYSCHAWRCTAARGKSEAVIGCHSQSSANRSAAKGESYSTSLVESTNCTLLNKFPRRLNSLINNHLRMIDSINKPPHVVCCCSLCMTSLLYVIVCCIYDVALLYVVYGVGLLYVVSMLTDKQGLFASAFIRQCPSIHLSVRTHSLADMSVRYSWIIY